MKQKVVFLDRDGTLIEDVTYLSDPQGVILKSGVAAALKQLEMAGFRLVIVSNQSGIGRGYFDSDDLKSVNKRLEQLLLLDGVVIEDWFHCPHSPSDNCYCRKPSPGLLDKANSERVVDWDYSFLIGDKVTDAEAAIARGVVPILLNRLDNFNMESWTAQRKIVVVTDFSAAVQNILAQDLVFSRKRPKNC